MTKGRVSYSVLANVICQEDTEKAMHNGSDKSLPSIGFMPETNPALGRRGIRLLLEHPELLSTQLSAILELSREFDIPVLIPIVALRSDD